MQKNVWILITVYISLILYVHVKRARHNNAFHSKSCSWTWQGEGVDAKSEHAQRKSAFYLLEVTSLTDSTVLNFSFALRQRLNVSVK